MGAYHIEKALTHPIQLTWLSQRERGLRCDSFQTIIMQTNKQVHRGVSLLEVLAAIFVVSIGLLGVLAVIPFGAYQVSKTQHAEYASNMLANAAEEILIRKMTHPASWQTVPATTTLDCTKFILFDPHESLTPSHHIVHVLDAQWQEVMRGRDDIVYTLHDDKRPDFSGQGDKIQSSGKYTWFFTYLPQYLDSYLQDVIVERIKAHSGYDTLQKDLSDYLKAELEDIIAAAPGATQSDLNDAVTRRIPTWQREIQRRVGNFIDSITPTYLNRSVLEPFLMEKLKAVPFNELDSAVDGDVLACYNRIPKDDVQVPPDGFSPAHAGGTFTLPNTNHLEQLSQTKYVLVTWWGQKTPKTLTIRVPVTAEASVNDNGRTISIDFGARGFTVPGGSYTVQLDLVEGTWCKIVFLDKSNPAKPKIVVTGELQNMTTQERQIYIPGGVLYHKSLKGIPIK